jgi:signal transduction histidine kinase
VLLNFNQSDCDLLEKFATQAAIAIENAQLYRKTQELAVIHERERFGMALHDGIMQSVYATGLSLQEAQHHMESKPEEASQRINQAIQELGQVLRDLRNYILGLRTGRYQGQDLATSLGQMAQELHANTLMNVNFTPPTKITVLGLNDAQTDELVHISQEILTNIRKHSYARNVNISLKREGEHVILMIQDDGLGFDLRTESSGYGLGNMRERAESLGATVSIETEKTKGTRIHLSTPVTGDALIPS